MIFRFFKYLFATPDDFYRDPVGYLGNQCGHIYLGFFLTTAYVWVVSIIDTYPSQQGAFVAVVFAYFMLWETLYHGWKGFDTIEDTAYFAAGASIYIFVDMQWVIDRVFFITVLMSAFLIGGAYVRWGHDR